MTIPYPLYIALVLSTLLTSALFLVSESSASSQDKRQIAISRCVELINSLDTEVSLIQNWKITNGRYQEPLTDDKSIFTYLDPPYDIGSNLYGRKGNRVHKSFDHDAFATICDRFIGPQLVSYNSSQLVKERFQGWTVAEFAHTYTMRSVGSYNTDQASRTELVLMNYEV